MTSTEFKICNKLNITADYYINMMYELGCTYLEEKTNNLTDVGMSLDEAKHHTNPFLFSRIWWNWWMREWMAVDRAFLRQESKSVNDYVDTQSLRIKVPPIDMVNMIISSVKTVKQYSNSK